MFELRTAVAAALIGALTLAAPAFAAQAKASAKPAAPKAAASVKPKKELHGFKRYDKNADGTITLAEVRAEYAKKPKRLARLEKRFKRWDANGDGKVTVAEWNTRHHRERAARKAEKAAKSPAPAKKK